MYQEQGELRIQEYGIHALTDDWLDDTGGVLEQRALFG